MMIRNILILTVLAALVPTAMSSVSASSAEIALFSSDADSLSITGNEDIAKMDLKATNENGKTKKASDFQMTADNVLYIKVGDKVDVKDNVEFTKAITTDGLNNQKAIGITTDGVIDFTGYAQGVSTLDVVVDDDRAYEAIIVIGQQPPEVINKQVTKVNNNQETRLVVIPPEPPIPDPPCDPESDPECPVPPPPCDPESDPECPVDPVDPTNPVDPVDPEDPCSIDPTSPDCEMPTEEFPTEEIDCELQPELCEENIVEIPEEEEELTETTEIEEIEEEEPEEESSESEDESENEASEVESEDESEEE